MYKKCERIRAKENIKLPYLWVLRVLALPRWAAEIEMCQDVALQSLSLGYDKASEHLKLKWVWGG